MTAAELTAQLQRAGVQLWEDNGRLRYRAPLGVMTDDRLAALREHRDELLEQLRLGGDGPLPRVVAHPEATHEPFPVTDVQAAYLVGRRDVLPFGGVACQGYGELAFPDLDTGRLERAWRLLVRRHPMLRAVFHADGSQRVLEEVPDYEIRVLELRDAAPSEAAAAEAATRAGMDHRVRPPDRWPLFELRVTRGPARALLHFAIDFLIADFVSIQVILDELVRLYQAPDARLPELEVTFRDFRLAERGLREGRRFEADRAYWWGRIDDLPGAPELPLLPGAAAAPPRFRRHELALAPEDWLPLREQAARRAVTPSGALLAAYAEVIGRWSRQPRFTLDVTRLDRPPLHPQVNAVVGDFTAIELLAVEPDAGATFTARARALQAQLWQDLDHGRCSGVDVIREIVHRRGQGAALFPVVFTSTVGLAAVATAGADLGELVGGISQTPQVWIDCQVMERGRGLFLNWDVREGVFPPGLVEDAFAAFADLLRSLSGPVAWESSCPVALPAGQAHRRHLANATDAPLPDELLHDGLVARAARMPDRTAVVSGARRLTFAELVGRAEAVAERLASPGSRPAHPVAVVMDKGWEQVVAVLGILLAGGAYLPVDTGQPAARRDRILADAGVEHVLTQSWLEAAEWPADVATVAVDTLPAAATAPLVARRADPDDLAYVIYTSGSTGVPKGVMISHRAAVNTIVDVTRRFAVRVGESVLGLSSLGFDLSVYDVFGVPAAGGSLVLPDAGRRGDPSHWAELVAEHGITLLNVVPAQLQMLHDYLAAEPDLELASLRLAMMSGDWIPVGLPDQVRRRLPDLELVSLGGATEAAIWSIFHPIGRVDPEWRSIPYGRPLANQRFDVLDAAMRSRPEWVPGELHIGGAGLAMGYLGDPAQTAARFVRHPQTGERLYRTGDLGRYLPDGSIEILGREDSQVKIRGHRIELAEVEAALGSHPAVGASAVVVVGDRPLERRLAGFVEPARRPAPGPLAAADRTRLETVVGAAARDVMAAVDADRHLAYNRALDEVALLAMVEALRQLGLFAAPEAAHTLEEILAEGRVVPAHHRLVRRWLAALGEAGLIERDPADGRYRLPAAPGSDRLDAGWARLEAMRPATGDGGRLLAYFRESAAGLPALLRQEQDPVRMLFPAGGLDVADALHRDSLQGAWTRAVIAAAAVGILELRPPDAGPVRVLEVGAGVGGASAAAIRALAGADYLFTDLSQFFLNAAAERFADCPGVRFAVLDLDRDVHDQGLLANSFDLVLAGDVLHATRDLDAALGRLRDVLAPGGWLVFAEMTRDHPQIMTSLELMIRLDPELGDFADERRGRDQTFLARDRWEAAVERAGGEVALVLPRSDDPMAEIGMHVVAARFKTDREPLRAPELAGYLERRLPEYMVPAHLEVVDALPLTGNGKLDRRALRERLRAAPESAGAGGSEPRGELERRLAAAWGEVLALGSVVRDRTFFELGGDSLLAAQLAGRLREAVPEAAPVFFDDLLRRILQGPTLAALAEDLARREEAAPAASAGRSPVVVLAGDGSGVPVVLVHGADAGLEAERDLASALAATAPVLGLVVPDRGAYLDLDAASLVRRVAADHAQALLDAGYARVILAGAGFGGLLASEVAAKLVESGGEVERLVVIGDVRPEAERRRAPAGDEVVEHSLAAAAAHQVEAYAGDVTLVLPEDEPAERRTALTERWRGLCLGELRVLEEPDPARLAELIETA